MLESIGIIALIVAAYHILVRYAQNQKDNKEERRIMKDKSRTYRDLKYSYEESIKIGKPIMSLSEFEKKKEEVLNSREEREKVVKKIKKEEQEKLKIAENFKRMRIVGYKYDEFIFNIFNDKEELTWNELLDGVQKTFNLPRLNFEDRSEYNVAEILAPDEEIINIWLDNSLIEICDWSLWSEKNPMNTEHFKVGKILIFEHLQINDYDITYGVWLKDRNITLKHSKYYELYMAKKAEL
jgi:hypothetical protein